MHSERPTPFPKRYEDLVFDENGLSQTIIVNGLLPDWLTIDDGILYFHGSHLCTIAEWEGNELAIQVKRRNQTGFLSYGDEGLKVSFEIKDGKPNLTTVQYL